MKLVKKVNEPWFSLIAMGFKTCEGRLCKGDFSRLKIGDKIQWTNDSLGFDRKVETTVLDLIEYDNFAKYLQAETIASTLPAYGMNTYKQAISVYRMFYTAEQEKEHGVLAIMSSSRFKKRFLQ